mmetsp:Transcript_36048/g.52834  ORF Transcript_36048/g.52834 Transcript_36048/m.52834 type:complete len:174 (-) Transcript_36048:228-749(-)|eukprot:CAMPEP_0195526808 /NCGR_PEP_ID=MMETSP0794_2-20130614/28122_1 /TAXON_ID=515487 /ORGANISM="Stephanopyxis turris, Strain CCMP 815" /LENGTH=173 /DNA_ID=CAMNT_0040657591 /DNA_START=83 /DNA_END=604 /DNA_ORIENTATION=-
MALRSLHFALLIALTTTKIVDGFVPSSMLGTKVPTRATTARSSSSSQLQMLMGPKQMLAMEKKKNPEKFEATINNLMKSKKLSRAQAEQRYGTFLVDPEGFALAAAEIERKELGYKDWKEQAIARSDDPEATRKRIDEFQKKNSFKGTAIIIVFFGAVIAFNAMNPYVPPGQM